MFSRLEQEDDLIFFLNFDLSGIRQTAQTSDQILEKFGALKRSIIACCPQRSSSNFGLIDCLHRPHQIKYLKILEFL
ncbi:hypothetical protein M5K25_001051 [Dendrobium thyrsiflorum]|uniref:Uncharacterized protein n=1 Tax=Dendrobium thyrsiflorum TaxID=117978 RepID=A0ABD0VV17_DENTH